MVLTGGIGVGKTRAVLALAGDLRRQHLRVGGVASLRVLVGGETVGYLVRDLTTGEEHPLCSRPAPGLPFRQFTFSPEGLAFANAALVRATREAEVIVVDGSVPSSSPEEGSPLGCGPPSDHRRSSSSLHGPRLWTRSGPGPAWQESRRSSSDRRMTRAL